LFWEQVDRNGSGGPERLVDCICRPAARRNLQLTDGFVAGFVKMTGNNEVLMREHQIIINLKPEHFEEVQRMARAAGSKSIGLFVRQKLLSTLGLSGSSKPQEGGELDSAELKLLTGELRRLHRELQIFLADSTPATSPQSTLPFPRAVQENFLAEGAPLLPESEPLDDEIAEQPPLPYTSPLPLPYTTPMPPPDEIHAFAEVDELENLAERAFAISPRLGALDEPQPKPFPDPLKELLNDAFLNTVQADDEQPAPTVEEEEAAAEEEGAAEELVEEEGEEEFVEEGADEDAAQDSVVEAVTEEVEEEENIEVDDKEDGDENPDSEYDNPPPPASPPPTPPVISGGPPPRKRNT
jgi:hypothetical protein